MAQLCLIEVAGGLGVGVQQPSVQRPPLPIVDSTGDVGHDDVGMQERIAGAGGAVHERGGDEPLDGNAFVTVVAAARPGRLAFQVTDRRPHGRVVSRLHGRSDFG